MRPLPFLSIDWLGGVLWSVTLLELIWLFHYGEYYNWWDSRLWRGVVVATVITAYFAVSRMHHIHHPYIDPKAFRYKTLLPILGMFAVAEVMNATPQVLQNAFTGSISHWGMMTTAPLNLITIVGNVTGCLFCLWWMKMTRQAYTRLLTIGFALLLSYQVAMYFIVYPGLNFEMLIVPTFLRSFGYTIFFVTMTLYLEELMPSAFLHGSHHLRFHPQWSAEHHDREHLRLPAALSYHGQSGQCPPLYARAEPAHRHQATLWRDVHGWLLLPPVAHAVARQSRTLNAEAPALLGKARA